MCYLCAGAAVDRAAEDKKAEKGGKLYLEWHSGKLHHIKSGGAEAQSLLDRLEANTGVAIVIWFAHWADSCRASIPALERCFAHPHFRLTTIRSQLTGFTSVHLVNTARWWCGSLL